MSTQPNQPRTTYLSYGKEARESLLAGVDAVANAVKVTLGPAGRHVSIHKSPGMPPSITKDGVTVAASIRALSNPFEDTGAQIIKGAAMQTAAIAGDGTTTSTVLAQAMIHMGLDAISKGENPVHLKREMDDMCAKVVSKLAELSSPLTVDSPELLSIATISANNDKDLAAVITEAMRGAGKDGIVSINDSMSYDTYVKKSTGLEIDKGFISDVFINVPERNRVEFEKPLILLYPKKISEANDIIFIANACAAQKRPLLVICENMDSSALGLLATNKLRGLLSSCVIKIPGFGGHSKDMLQDVAIAVGGVVVDEDMGVRLKEVTIESLGTAESVVITRESTTILGGGGDQKKIAARIEQISNFLNSDSAKAHEKHILHKRISILQSKAAAIFVGAPTELERKEKRDRVDDAVCAVRAALHEGYVAGSGNALTYLCQEMSPDPLTPGGQIVLMAMNTPFAQILKNAGWSESQVMNITTPIEYGISPDIYTKASINLVENGVIDPAKVIRVSLENAVSVAGMLLTTECAMVEG